MHDDGHDLTAWLEARLGEAGLRRTGAVEWPHVRPWATVLRAPTTGGSVWLKAAAPATAFEAGLYALLARAVPDHVLRPIALDVDRGWMLLPDGGATLGERAAGAERGEALGAALAAYGELQRALEPHAAELLACGAPDMRPEAMPGRFEEALDAAGRDTDTGRLVIARREEILGWCERLADSPLPPSLDHNDLHPWNVLPGDGTGPVRFYDWGDSVVAHPFAVALVPLGFVQRELDADAFTRARDAYLEVFADHGTPAELADTLDLACRVAKIARVLTWDRALRTARDQGESVPPRFAAAPAETLRAVLDPSPLGGA